MSENLSPDSLMLSQVDGEWQKLFAFLLWKTSGTNTVKITMEDMEAMADHFAPGMAVVYTHGHKDGISFSLVTEERARLLVAHERSTHHGST